MQQHLAALPSTIPARGQLAAEREHVVFADAQVEVDYRASGLLVAHPRAMWGRGGCMGIANKNGDDL